MKWKPTVAGLLLVFACSCFIFPGFVFGLGFYEQRMLGILLVAVVLWISELVPSYATGLIVLLLQLLLLSDRAPFMWRGHEPPLHYEDIFAQFSSPIIILFLGGFSIASVATKYKLDLVIARFLLQPFGTKPRVILLGLMLITAFFSMFMSNTATAAMMLAILTPVLTRLSSSDPARKGFLLSIPIAANIGGMGTPIGTPPNALALKYLSGNQAISFGEWMLFGLPLVAVLIVFAWWILGLRYRSEATELQLDIRAPTTNSKAAAIFYLTFACTVVLWLTGDLHGMNSYVVAMLPLVVFVVSGLLGTADIRNFNWEILWLLAGGMALGDGLAKSGLSDSIFHAVSGTAQSPLGAVLVCSAIAFLMSNFISHTVSANVILPLVATIAAGFSGESGDMSLRASVLQVALICSLGMALPVSTPPNALSYATGGLQTRDYLLIGGLVSVVGAVVVIAGSLVFF